MIAQVLRGGRQQGLLAAVSHGIGVGIYALLAALGLAVLMVQTPLLFNALRWLGAAFLLFLAYMALVRPSTFVAGEVDGQAVRAHHGMASGFMVAFLNPKLALFFLAVYTQFIDASSGFGQKMGMAGVSAAVDALWYVLVVILVSHPPVMAQLQHHAVNLQRLFGVLLVLVAVRVVWS